MEAAAATPIVFQHKSWQHTSSRIRTTVSQAVADGKTEKTRHALNGNPGNGSSTTREAAIAADGAAAVDQLCAPRRLWWRQMGGVVDTRLLMRCQRSFLHDLERRRLCSSSVNCTMPPGVSMKAIRALRRMLMNSSYSAGVM